MSERTETVQMAQKTSSPGAGGYYYIDNFQEARARETLAGLKLCATPAERLRYLRQKNGIKSAARAARALNLPTATYQQHENGIKGVSPSMAQTYAEFFGVPPAVILYGDDAVIYPEATEPQRIALLGSVNARGLILRNVTPQLNVPPTLTPVQKSRAPKAPAAVVGETDNARVLMNAVVVHTKALAPIYFENDLVFFEQLTRPLRPKEVDGYDAVITTTQGRMMLCQLKSSGNGWSIYVPNRAPISGREIYLASRVRWIKRG